MTRSLDFPPGRWRAAWIWPHRSTDWEGPTARRTAALVTNFELDGRPDRAMARLACIGRATWWINGHEVGRGPVRTNPRRMRWDDHDVTSLLRNGSNLVAILATADVDATAWSMPLPDAIDLRTGAIAFEIHADGIVLAPSDRSWRGTILAGWSASPSASLLKRGDELADLRSLPADWNREVAATASWPVVRERRAMVLGASGRANPPSFPVGPLAGRPVSRPRPDVVHFTASGATFLAPRITVGTLVVDLEGPAGSSVEIKGAERLLVDGSPRHEVYDSSLVLIADGTRRTHETVDLFGVHAVSVQAAPGVVVHSVGVNERLHPVDGDLRFACSDPRLEQIHEIGRRTVSICSLDSYVDCPTREQRAWTGDSVVHQLVDLTTNRDWSLAEWHPVLAASPRADGMLPMAVAGEIEHTDISIVPDWALHWIHSVHNLHTYVGDRERVAELLPVVEGVLRWFDARTDDDGVPVDLPGWVLIDWSAIHSDGANSTIAGLWGRGLLEFAEMSEWLGDSGRAAWARRRHERLAIGFEKFWDPRRAVYVDQVIGCDRRPMVSQHGAAAAIVGRLAPRERWSRLAEVITDESRLVHAAFARADGPSDPGTETDLGGVYMYQGHPEPWWDVERQVVRAQPFFRYVVHDALVDAGSGGLLPDLLLDWNHLIDRCSTSFGETWYGGTTCHGWSSTPTRDLVQYVLGVRPGEPGMGVVEVEPHLGRLDWIEADVPTPRGVLNVRVDRRSISITGDHDATVRAEGALHAVRPGSRTVIPRTIRR